MPLRSYSLGTTVTLRVEQPTALPVRASLLLPAQPPSRVAPRATTRMFFAAIDNIWFCCKPLFRSDAPG